jgi:hypothetical protein
LIQEPKDIKTNSNEDLVAGRQGGGKKINECYKQKTGVGECYLETRGGSPHPRG